MIVKFNITEKNYYMEKMSSWEKLSEVFYDWDENELKTAFSVERFTRNRKHILKRLVGRYNSIRAIKLD